MAGARDDDRWGDDAPDAPLDPATLRAARAKVSLPATLLIAAAVFMLIWAVVNIAVIASGYDTTVALFEFLEQQQPPGPARDDFAKELAKARTRDRSIEYAAAAVSSALGIALDIFVLIGGLRMKNLRGRTLAMAGAVCAMIPANSCCCVGLPLGIWALAVLANPDVKAAFEAAKRRGLPDPEGA